MQQNQIVTIAQKLDGSDITKAEQIQASQVLPQLRLQLQETSKQIQAKKQQPQQPQIKYDEHGNKLFGNDPVSRKAAAEELKNTREANGVTESKGTVDASKIGEVESIGTTKLPRVNMTPQEEIEKFGKIMQRNEGKWDFKLFEEGDNVILDIPAGKFMSTANIEVDVQPTYIRVTIKGKVLQLLLPAEVNASAASAQRSAATGHLKLVMPKALHVISKPKKQTKVDTAQVKLFT